MKKMKMARMIGMADEKFVAEAAPKASKRGSLIRRFTLIAACVTLVLTSVCLWLFLPYETADELPERPDRNSLPAALRGYEDSEYLDLMYAFYRYDRTQKINSAKNNFENYIADLFDFGMKDAMESPMPEAPGASMEGTGMNGVPEYDSSSPSPSEKGDDESYVETTDNQVSGVIEADLVKRTKTHIFYLDSTGNVIRVYSIAGEDSRIVSTVSLDPLTDNRTSAFYNLQMFLSSDGKTLVLIGNKNTRIENANEKHGSAYLSTAEVISYDVSDPENVSESGRFAITGGLLTARLVDGKILLMTRYLAKDIDYDSPESFLPSVDCGDGFKAMAADDIIFPEKLTSKYYTVVSQLDVKTLALEGAAGCLCYSSEIYVSKDKVFLSRLYVSESEYEEEGKKYTKRVNATEICALGYGKEGFSILGSASVDGSLKNQYSMDEYEGVLRVVTTTSGWLESTSDRHASLSPVIPSNAALFCIDLSTFEIVGEVRDFAPNGETVESVRFDGTKAYVCTAVVITFTDPVYFFDLSDMSNITYTDTGVIEGYSSSLVNFGDGFLLGIGFGATRDTLKIEVYYEDGGKVISVASYEREAVEFSQDYKSYFIDREKGLVGLLIYDWDYRNKDQGLEYVLLSFDGYNLKEVLNEEMPKGGMPDFGRAVLADGYFYILSAEDFKAIKLFD